MPKEKIWEIPDSCVGIQCMIFIKLKLQEMHNMGTWLRHLLGQGQ